MAMDAVDDINIENQEKLITPFSLKGKIPISDLARETVSQSRRDIEAILNRTDSRIFVVVGPCSIHDIEAAHEYARRLKELSEKVEDCMLLVMRVYFEKPRTTTGWKGLINDPDMNDSFNIEKGLRIGRKLLIDVSELGLPTSTEALDPITPQYMQDLISWSAIGARTTESQIHRELASGLSMPVGFKNGTSGSLEVAINALKSVASPHRFLGINKDGQVSVVHSAGNPSAHIVLRGGGGKPNYDYVSVKLAEEQLENAGLIANIMIDCSHANSNKDHTLQPLVIDNVANQIAEGNRSIVALMVESNLKGGNQKLSANPDEMEYGVSVTDACVDWESTEDALLRMADTVRGALKKR